MTLEEAIAYMRQPYADTSPDVRRRARAVVEQAIRDLRSTRTPEEHAALRQLLINDVDPNRTIEIRIWVTHAEIQRVQQMAEAEGMMVSEFVRARLGL